MPNIPRGRANEIRRDQEYQDQRETLIKVLVAGEKSGASKHTLDEIWRGVKKRHGIDG